VADSGQEGAVAAALAKAAPYLRDGVQRVTHRPEQSGRMSVFSYTRGRWQELGVDEPRRG